MEIRQKSISPWRLVSCLHKLYYMIINICQYANFGTKKSRPSYIRGGSWQVFRALSHRVVVA
jgi:hypothetical protein